MPVLIEYADEPEYFHFQLGIDRRGVAQGAQMADGFEAACRQRDLRRTQIAGCAFQRMSRMFDRLGVGADQSFFDRRQHGLVPVEKQHDQLCKEFVILADVVKHLGGVEDPSIITLFRGGRRVDS